MVQLKLDEIQLGGIEFLKDRKHCIVNLFTGLGKSDLLLSYLKDIEFVSCFIIVPKSILLRWVKQVEDYFGKNRCIHVISFGMVKTFANLIEEADIICLDEPKLLKNTNNQVFKVLMDLEDRSADGQQKILLDATIIENNLGELDAIAEWFGGITDRYEILDLIYPKGNKKNVAVRPTIWRRIKIPIPANRMPVVKFFELQLANTLIPTLKSKNTVNAAINALLDSINAIDKTGLGSLKLNVLVDLIRTRHHGDAGIICVTRKDAMDKICDRLWKEGYEAAKFHGDLSAKERQEVVDKFELGAIKWVVATKAGERGLNLRKGTVCINFDLPWSGSSLIQRDRVTRRDGDLTKTTMIYVLMFEDTVEELVYQKVKAKVRMNKNLGEGIIGQQRSVTWKEFLIEKWQRVFKVDLEKIL